MTPSAGRLAAAETLVRAARDSQTVALWTGYRFGILDTIAPESSAELLDNHANEGLEEAEKWRMTARWLI